MPIDPWREPYRAFSETEIKVVRLLRKYNVGWTDIADILVDLGFPARCETAFTKMRKQGKIR